MKKWIGFASVVVALAVVGFLVQKKTVQQQKLKDYRWVVINSQIAQMEIQMEAVSLPEAEGSEKLSAVVQKSLMRSIMTLNLEEVCLSELDEKSRRIFVTTTDYLSENFKDPQGEIIPLNFDRFEC